VTDVALRDYLERRLEDLDRRLSDRFLLSDSAVAKAERTMNERLNSMNEFRDALKDQANRMATRVELERLETIVSDLQQAKANLEGRLVVFSAGTSMVVSGAIWLLTRLVK
jgi:hypothetical protein